MAILINPDILRKSGFRDIESDEIITAAFHSIHAFVVRGIKLEDPTTIISTGEVDKVIYKLGIGNSINQISLDLLGDELVEDESKWMSDTSSTAPFMLLHFGPTTAHSISAGLMKREESGIHTYDCYAEAGAELRLLEKKALSSVITSVTTSFSSLACPVYFQPLERFVFGITDGGETLHDFRFSGNFTGYVSGRVSGDELRKMLENSTNFASTIYRKAARYYHLALDEKDALKRFLYFFLSIEVMTQLVFGSINHDSHAKKTVNVPDRVSMSAYQLFTKQRKELKGLGERFIWCAVCVWENVTDSDVVEFQRLKEVRDGLAHGRLTEPKASVVTSVEALACKLLKEK